jgi:hypothetical protein
MSDGCSHTPRAKWRGNCICVWNLVSRGTRNRT